MFSKGSESLPTFYQDATDTKIPADLVDKYMWAKTRGEVPTEPDQNGERWVEAAQPTKPGVDYYDLACFVVTESAKYRSASAAGSAVSKRINKIVDPGEDFNISGGNWKMDEANVSYDR